MNHKLEERAARELAFELTGSEASWRHYRYLAPHRVARRALRIALRDLWAAIKTALKGKQK